MNATDLSPPGRSEHRNEEGRTAEEHDALTAAAQAEAGPAPAPGRGWRRQLLRRSLIAVVLLVGLGGLTVFAGFLAFLTQIPVREPIQIKPADAIVVLTGGASRIADAVNLLAEGRGRRLLITGVNPITSPLELKRTLPSGEELLTCCIDLGHKALNTRGNAIEAAEWARSQRFRSLVVVTSAWHMPRALVELNRSLPDVELVAYPVVTSRMEAEQWWRNPATLKLLFKEYLKYMMAKAKIRPAQAVAEADAARSHAPAEARVSP
ncbi:MULTISPECIES: YdcF family protein [unclassified Xanthobacter]|uniref:YdcF family protein n=1 Tax=unclassified Xanthobacter TaxID=2623496 RepID=UPI001EE069B0|nr:MULTISPECIES: YdcF family protein [unclassified Xanthobacter]